MGLQKALLNVNNGLNKFFSNLNASEMITGKTVKMLDEALGDTGKYFDNLAKNLSGENVDAAKTVLRGRQERMNSKIFDEKLAARTGTFADKTAQYYSHGGTTGDLVKGYMGIGKGNTLTSGQRKARYGTAIGVGGIGMGSAIGKRYKEGGTVTRNAQGEKDVVGIPFF